MIASRPNLALSSFYCEAWGTRGFLRAAENNSRKTSDLETRKSDHRVTIHNQLPILTRAESARNGTLQYICTDDTTVRGRPGVGGVMLRAKRRLKIWLIGGRKRSIKGIRKAPYL